METRVDRSELTKLTACVCGNLRSATRAVTQLFDETFKPLGLRATQFSLLAVNELTGSITITAMADLFTMDRTTLTRNLKPLERQGLLTIEPGDDKRTREVTLTDQGRQAVADGLPLWEKAQAKMVTGLGQECLQSLLSHLSEVSAVARES